MNDTTATITRLEFTRYIGEYFSVGDDTKVILLSYSTESGKFDFKVQTINVKTKHFTLAIGESFNPVENVSIQIVGYSIKTGRVEIKISAPKNIDINRG